MGLQVLLVGHLRPDLGVSGTHEGVPVADIRHPEAVQDAVARLAGRSSGDGSLEGSLDGVVLVLCSPSDVPEVRRQLSLLTVALPHVATALEPVPGTPLTVGVCGALVTDPDGSRDAADQLALLDRLRTAVWSGVWVPSVSRLADPQPSLGQHLRSWFGGPGFLAVAGEGSRVLGCRDATFPEVAEVAPGGVLMVADTEAPAWVVPAAMTATGAAERTDYPSWRDPRDAFGVPACVELVVVPADLEGLHGGPSRTSSAATPCPGCARRHHRPVCPYCRMVRPAAPDGTDGTDPDRPVPTSDLHGADA